MQYLKRRNKGMKIKKFALAVGCMVLLCGCTKSNIVKPEQSAAEPDFNMYFDITIDQEQLKADVDDIFLDLTDYPMADEIDFEINEEEQFVNITVVVKDGTSPEDAANYTMAVIKGVNDQVAVQDFTYGESGDDTYGGLYQDNAIFVKIFERTAFDAGKEPMYEAEIPKDVYQKIVIE